MFIPPSKLNEQLPKSSQAVAQVRLKSSHILIMGELAQPLFGNSPNVNLVYYPNRRTLMLARKDDELFASLHKAKQFMLKDRSLNGDKSIAIHEILIDHDVNTSDRDLEFTGGDGSGILSIQL